MGTSKQFTPELKREAVQLLESGSRPASTLARELGVRRNPLYTWPQELHTRGVPWVRGAEETHHDGVKATIPASARWNASSAHSRMNWSTIGSFSIAPKRRWQSRTIVIGSIAGSASIRRSAIGVGRSLSGRRVGLNPRVCFLGPPHPDPTIPFCTVDLSTL